MFSSTKWFKFIVVGLPLIGRTLFLLVIFWKERVNETRIKQKQNLDVGDGCICLVILVHHFLTGTETHNFSKISGIHFRELKG